MHPFHSQVQMHIMARRRLWIEQHSSASSTPLWCWCFDLCCCLARPNISHGHALRARNNKTKEYQKLLNIKRVLRRESVKPSSRYVLVAILFRILSRRTNLCCLFSPAPFFFIFHPDIVRVYWCFFVCVTFWRAKNDRKWFKNKKLIIKKICNKIILYRYLYLKKICHPE